MTLLVGKQTDGCNGGLPTEGLADEVGTVLGGDLTRQPSDQEVRLGIHVGIGAEAEAEELAEATLELRRELLELDVKAVELARAGEPPPGTRSIELVALGTLIVTIAKSGLLAPAVAVIRSWIDGHPQRSIRLELDGDVLELTGLSSSDQRRLAEEWLRRHPSV